MTTRTAEELLAAWDAACKESPLILNEREGDIFSKALKERTRLRRGQNNGLYFDIIDRERVIGDGVKSVLDDRVYTSRSAYETHLKDNGCRVVGNDVRNKKRMETL